MADPTETRFTPRPRPTARPTADAVEAVLAKSFAGHPELGPRAAQAATSPVGEPSWFGAVYGAAAAMFAQGEKAGGHGPASSDVSAARKAVERQEAAVERAQSILDRESRSGFGPKARNAQSALEKATAVLAQKEASLDRAISAERNRTPSAVAFNLALGLGAPLGGMAVGKGYFAPKIEKRHIKAVTARNTQLKGIAKEIAPNVGKISTASGAARVRGLVAAADKLKLARQRGPIGLATAGLLAVEAYVLRSTAADAHDETSANLLRATGLGLGFVAGGLIAERTIQNATQSKIVDARALARVEEARTALSATGSRGILGEARDRVFGAKQNVARPAAVGVRDIDKLSVSELRKIARERGVERFSSLRADDLRRTVKASMSGRKPPPLDFSSMTSAQRMKEASRLQITGRSKMSPRQLLNALHKAGGKLKAGRVGALVAVAGLAAAAASGQAAHAKAFLSEDAKEAARTRRSSRRAAFHAGRRATFTRADGSTGSRLTARQAAAYRRRRGRKS